jgi:hypothetical protein
MNKRIVLLVVASIALVSLPLLLRAQPAEEGYQGTKWEYARLTISNGECAIETTEATRTAASSKELYEKTFGVRGTKPFKNDTTLLTRIGGNGWEMTGMAVDASRSITVYVFKRPVR